MSDDPRRYDLVAHLPNGQKATQPFALLPAAHDDHEFVAALLREAWDQLQHLLEHRGA